MCLLKLHSIVYARPHCWQMNGDLTKSVKCKEKYYCQKVSSNRRATGQLVYREAIDFLTWMEVSNRPVNVSRVLRLRMNSQPSIEAEHLFVDYYNETSKLIASLCQKIDRRRERGRKKFPDRDSIVYICSSKTEWNLYRETGINFRRRVVSVKCELHRNRETVIVIRFFSWGARAFKSKRIVTITVFTFATCQMNQRPNEHDWWIIVYLILHGESHWKR